MKTEVNTREEYDSLLKHGIDALCDDRYHLEIGLRIAIQRRNSGETMTWEMPNSTTTV